MATMTKAQAKNKLKKLAPYSPLRDCPVCGDRINDTDDSWEYIRTKSGSDIFIHRFCIKHWGSDLSKGELSKLRKEHELTDF